MSTIQKKAHEFFTNHFMGVLSTATEKAMPWGAAVYYAAGDKFTLYFFTREDGKKYHNLKANPHVAFTIVDNEAQATLQLAGTAHELPMGDEQNEAYAKLALVHTPDSQSWTPPISKLRTESEPGFIVMRIKPTTVQFADYKDAEGAKHGYVHSLL